jgi:DNA-binding phage protein
LTDLDTICVYLNTVCNERNPDAIRKLLDELEANRRSRRSAWATLHRLRRFLEEHGTRIGTPEDRSFETEGEAIESGFRRTLEARDAAVQSLVRAVYRFRDATLVAEKKADFGSALQNLYRELERAENLVGPN